MKVVHFIASLDKTSGGTTAIMKLLATELKNKVELIIVAGLSPTPVDIVEVKVQYFNMDLGNCFLLTKKFIAFLINEKPNLIHINGIWTPQNWLFQKAAQELGIKVILSPHGMLEPYILSRHPIKKKVALALYQHKAIKKADYIHATAQSELDQIRKLGYHQSATIIPNGIDLSEVVQKTEKSNGLIKNILFLSRIHPKKGIELLIEAISNLKSDQIKVIIAGEGDSSYIASLKKLSTSKGVSHLFDFIGGVYGNKKWELFQQADLFVLPTYSENFGIVVAEALAVGIPVITTTGTPWQELETYQCGWWIDLNLANLKGALNNALIKTPKELNVMGLHGRKLIEEKYEIKSITRKMLELYESIKL